VQHWIRSTYSVRAFRKGRKVKALMLLPTLFALAISSQAQTQPPTPGPAPLSVLGCKWTRAARSEGSSGDQERKGKEAALDQQIALANREADDAGKNVSGESLTLGQRKQAQLDQIPLPAGVVKGYLYEVHVRNITDQTIKRLQWAYVFTDVLTQKEIVRHAFYDRTKIPPGHEKKLAAFTRGSPPSVINVKELSKNGNKPWGESVVIDRVEFADGTIWESLAKTNQVKPANN
jgi:hypothetical protein